jgi:hypothetical protein
MPGAAPSEVPLRAQARELSAKLRLVEGLNMMEIEIAVLRSQCLDRRIAERGCFETKVAAWQRQRNDAGARVTWMFTAERAREKIGHAYPDPQHALPQAA